ncbi:unnamed protein product [Choristocarpus tenellus]
MFFFCRTFCQDFSTYKREGRVGYCFKQFDKRPVEFLYLVPPSLAPQVPLLGRTPAAAAAEEGHLCCMVVTSYPQQEHLRSPTGPPQSGGMQAPSKAQVRAVLGPGLIGRPGGVSPAQSMTLSPHSQDVPPLQPPPPPHKASHGHTNNTTNEGLGALHSHGPAPNLTPVMSSIPHPAPPRAPTAGGGMSTGGGRIGQPSPGVASTPQFDPHSCPPPQAVSTYAQSQPPVQGSGPSVVANPGVSMPLPPPPPPPPPPQNCPLSRSDIGGRGSRDGAGAGLPQFSTTAPAGAPGGWEGVRGGGQLVGLQLPGQVMGTPAADHGKFGVRVETQMGMPQQAAPMTGPPGPLARPPPPPPPPPPPMVIQPTAPPGGAPQSGGAQWYNSGEASSQHGLHQQMEEVAQRVASVGPGELEAMRQLPGARTQHPFIFDDDPGFAKFRVKITDLVMPRLQGRPGIAAQPPQQQYGHVHSIAPGLGPESTPTHGTDQGHR